MKSLLLLLLVAFSTSANAAIAIKPGLWKVSVLMDVNGKEMDPMAEMKKALAQLPPEQRKMMEAQLSKSAGAGAIAEDGVRVCYTKEMLEKNGKLVPDAGNQKCKTTIKTQTPKRTEMSFDCDGGTKGDMVFNVKNDTHYDGTADITEKGGRRTKAKYVGEFLKADCGTVKPLVSNP